MPQPGGALASEIAVALVLLGLVLAGATSVQVPHGLTALDGIRRGIGAIRSGGRRRFPAGAPVEVRPLVAEFNTLMDAQEQETERSRRRAADLADGLKTPLAALASDAESLRPQGGQDITRDIEAIIEAMGRTVDRELARVRLNTRHSATVTLDPLVQLLLTTLARTPAGARIRMATGVPLEFSLPLERTDLADALGNLLDNAVRHAASQVHVTAHPGAGGVSVTAEDEGPGLAMAARAGLLGRGARLDERGEGAGLGLAIVRDVLAAHGWRLILVTSALGCLKAMVAPPPNLGAPLRDLTRMVADRRHQRVHRCVAHRRGSSLELPPATSSIYERCNVTDQARRKTGCFLLATDRIPTARGFQTQVCSIGRPSPWRFEKWGLGAGVARQLQR